jgi:FKBP-type peptidyl-prolyl cis-trans isomerase
LDACSNRERQQRAIVRTRDHRRVRNAHLTGRTTAMLAAALLVLAETNEWGRKYLEKNRFRKEFVTLPSGLQYRSVEEGGGKRHPTPDTECLCHYEGRTAFQYEPGKRRWQTFDSSAHALCLREHACRPLACSHTLLPTPRLVCAQATSERSHHHSLQMV